MWDELDEPLGFGSGVAAAQPARGARATGRAVALAAAVAAAVALLPLTRGDAPLGGEPRALAKVEVLAAPSKLPAPEVTASVRPAPAPIASAEQVEATSGVKVTRGSGGPPKALIIDVARALGVKPAPTQSNP